MGASHLTRTESELGVKLDTSDREHDALWKLVHGARESSDTVKVPKLALKHLLQDHAAMVGRLTTLRIHPEPKP